MTTTRVIGNSDVLLRSAVVVQRAFFLSPVGVGRTGVIATCVITVEHALNGLVVPRAATVVFSTEVNIVDALHGEPYVTSLAPTGPDSVIKVRRIVLGTIAHGRILVHIRGNDRRFAEDILPVFDSSVAKINVSQIGI